MVPADQESLQHFRVCATCYGLDERGRSDGRDQHCRCWPRDLARWEGFDFNERVILCWCCGQTPVESGHRFSLFFCRECQLLAMGASIWAERLVIPIGRHSLMHAFVPGSRAATLDGHEGRVEDLAATVATTMKAIVAGSQVLQAWRPRCVADNLHDLGLLGGVELTAYLEAAGNSRTLRSRIDAFAAMCRFIKAGG